MKKILLSLGAAALLTAGLTGCNGGGGCSGNTSTGGSCFTYSQLADEFVYRLNVDLGYDVDLVKTNTEQHNYIVVYDYDFGTYDAYFIGDYNPGEDLGSYVNFYNSSFYFDLDYIGGNYYEDPFSGTLFQEGMTFQRNSLKMAGIQQKTIIDRMSSNLVQSYNLSQGTADKIAKAGVMVQLMNKQGAGEGAYAELMKEVTGTDLAQWEKAYESGDLGKVQNLLNTTAKSLGASPADINNLLKGFGN